MSQPVREMNIGMCLNESGRQKAAHHTKTWPHTNIRAHLFSDADHLQAAFKHSLKLWQPSSLFNTTSRLRSPLCLSLPVGDKDRNRKEDPKPTHQSDHKLWLCKWKGPHL